MQTHDLPSRFYLSEKFKNKNCKVFFSADGCDELFGGQQLYKKVFNKKMKKNLNHSPYSTYKKLFNFSLNNSSNLKKNYSDTLSLEWKKATKKYNFLNSYERNIQSSLYLDYFVQSINVANRSNDLICCSFGIEPRNIFIQKNILKIILNIPLKYKFNIDEKIKVFAQKKLLKLLFLKYFKKQLILEKEGFSGFPNSLRKNLKLNEFSLTKKLLNLKINDSRYLTSELEWKLINLEIFLKNYVRNKI